MNTPYEPPYSITTLILRLVSEISEWIGCYAELADAALTPHLRYANRIKMIQASLAIENNTLTTEQVTAVIEGKRVLGLPREIQEVRNAFQAYECLEEWSPLSEHNLLVAHGLLMSGLVDDPGILRRGGVAILNRAQIVHMAPSADRVPHLVHDVLNWLKETEEHPLVASCVFHYGFEFIHPFSDGNGRMGRLWQTLILSHWKPIFAYLPVETVIHDRQQEYYHVLAQADQQANATPFIEFMLGAIQSALQNTTLRDQVSDPVMCLLTALSESELGSVDLMSRLGLLHRPTFRKNYLVPALSSGWVESTQPNSPRSPTQRYRLTDKGRYRLKTLE